MTATAPRPPRAMAAPENRAAGDVRASAAFIAIGLALMLLALALAIASPRFGYDVAVRDMPVPWLVAGLVLAGLVYLPLPWLIRRLTAGAFLPPRALFMFMLAAGLAMRLALLPSEPVLEDDYQRYLWDGAVTAHGLNPYANAPEAAKPAPAPEPGTALPGSSPLGHLALKAGPVLDRVNHPDLHSVYPPVAQGAFALASMIAPFSLTAWRLVLLAFEAAALGLLLVLLRDLGRTPLWAALYWWNPVAVKELANSAHMEAVVVALFLAGLALAARRRLLAATGATLLAAGAKIWPLLLLPLIWRPLAPHARTRLAAAIALSLAALALGALPILAGGLSADSGFVAYATAW